MTDFSELIGGMRRTGERITLTVSDDWLQGRTIYGGLATALCHEAARRAFADLPPLRSAQMAFAGPASGELSFSAVELRRGKSTVFVGVDLHGEAGLATRATFCFAAGRACGPSLAAEAAPPVGRPEAYPNFFENAPPQLRFAQHIDGRHAGGALPFSGAAEPTMLLWLRHRDTAVMPGLTPLLALADAPPPAIISALTGPGVISTMTWSIDLLTAAPETSDGWWLIRTAADAAAGGYSSQVMTVWNAAGQAVMASRQNVAVFA